MQTVETRNLVTALERRAFEAHVDLAALRHERADACAEADRHVAELEALDAVGARRVVRLAALAILWMLPIALGVVGVAS